MNGFTPYPKINELLERLRAEMKRILGDQLAGIYVGGSLAAGDFNPETSDIDLLATSWGALSNEKLAQLNGSLRQLRQRFPKWGREVELSIMPAKALRRYDPDNAHFPRIERGESQLELAGHGRDWVIQFHILREWGKRLTGMPLKRWMAPVSPNQLRRAALATLGDWWLPMVENGEKLEPDGYRWYAILTMCRILRTAQEGTVVTKPEAGRWALAALPAKWRPIIEAALAWRGGELAVSAAETQGLIQLVADECRQIPIPTELVLLGTGTPNCEPRSFQSAWAVVAGEQPYLVDSGGGAIQRISQAFNRGIDPLTPAKLTRLFLTHLHPDHTVGLADLIIAPWVADRAEPLQIFGPAGTKSLCDGIVAAYEPGIAEHRDGLAPIDHSLAVEATEIAPGLVYQDENVQVEAFSASHGGMPAFGYKFVTSDKTIVISGDSCPTPEIVAAARGCDILLHEVYSAGGLATRPAAWQKYHSAVHTSGVELAKIAAAAQPKRLALTHQLIWGETTEADLLAEIRAGYDGEIIWGRDLDVFE